MIYQEARVYLDNAARYGSVLGLENMTYLLDKLGNPQDQLKFIHIAGTNGKGSLLAYLSTTLTRAGYRVGRYLSPTLFSYLERFQLDGEEMGEDVLAALTTKVAGAADEVERETGNHPTVFEMETAISFCWFADEKADFVVLECGMGGATDATNVVKTSILEVLTSISMDHMGFLGNTLGEIAKVKAGIIKPGTAVVTTWQDEEALEQIRAVSQEQNAALTIADQSQITNIRYGCETQSFDYFGKTYEVSLAGHYQVQNAALAITALHVLQSLGVALTEEQILDGIRNTVWIGRFTIIRKDPVFIIDGAHNEAAALEMRQSLQTYFSDKKIYYLFGVLGDKEYEKIISITAPLAEQIVAIETPNNVRALPAEKLAEAIAKVNPQVEVAGSVADGVKRCLEISTKDDVIVAFGSLSFLGLVRDALQNLD